jgi:hypothetical protein
LPVVWRGGGECLVFVLQAEGPGAELDRGAR